MSWKSSRYGLVIGLLLMACRSSPEASPTAASAPRSSSPLSSSVQVAAAKKRFEVAQVVLYQPDPVLEERLGDAGPLGDYIKKIQAVCEEYLSVVDKPETLDIVVAVKPSGHSRVWFVSPRPDDDGLLKQLRQSIEQIKPVAVKHGPIAFAIQANLAGAKRGASESEPSMPKEWKDAVSQNTQPTLIPDGILSTLWPGP